MSDDRSQRHHQRAAKHPKARTPSGGAHEAQWEVFSFISTEGGSTPQQVEEAWTRMENKTMTPTPMIACTLKDCPMNGLYHTGSARQDEKQLQRRQGEEEIKAGITTPQQMRERNGYFAIPTTIDFGQDDF